jgi:hypothetical protein
MWWVGLFRCACMWALFTACRYPRTCNQQENSPFSWSQMVQPVWPARAKMQRLLRFHNNLIIQNVKKQTNNTVQGPQFNWKLAADGIVVEHVDFLLTRCRVLHYNFDEVCRQHFIVLSSWVNLIWGVGDLLSCVFWVSTEYHRWPIESTSPLSLSDQ